MRDEDELWREIVENYGDRAILDDPSSEEGLPADEDPGEGPGEGPGTAAGTGLLPSDPEPEEPPEPAAPAELRDDWEDEGRFVPGEPPPIPLPSPPRLMAWFGVFGMPALLLVSVVAGQWLPTWVGTLMAAWFVGGFVYLVKNMPDEPPDPWDDGARL